MSESRAGGALQDASVLYGLALSIGRSLDPAECCQAFLSALNETIAIDASAVWVRREHFAQGPVSAELRLLHAEPTLHTATTGLDAAHPLVECADRRRATAIGSEHPHFESLSDEFELDNGIFGVFRLADVGYLMLHSDAANSFDAGELDHLGDVMDKFGRAIEGCLAHKRTVWEVQERQKAHRARRESEARFRLLYDDNPSMYFTLDHQGRVVSVNRYGADQLGYEVGELIGQPVIDVFHEDDKEQVLEHLNDAIRDPGTIHRWSFRKRRKDGSILWVEEFVRAIPDRLLVVCQDVTDQVLAQEEHRKLALQIQHAQKLESLGVLAGGVAHDFNNLLTGILGMAELARLQLPSSSPARANIQTIEKSALRAADLCDQLLAYSGKGKLVSEPLNLSAIVDEMSDLFAMSVDKAVHVRFRLSDSRATIEGDPSQIGQVIMNLVTNASEAIDEAGGLITVSTGQIECDHQYLLDSYLGKNLAPGPYAFVEVEDDGCGMDKETQARIFDPFYSTKFTGRGLGLAALLGIVRGHNGTLNIYSEPGRGTTFKILFPISGQTAPDKDELPPTEAWRGHGTVLLVDDEREVRQVGRTILEKFGFDVLTAEDGDLALNIVREKGDAITVVLLDMTMPRMSGEETLTAMRALEPELPVILCSGYNEPQATGRAARTASNGFLKKPYRIIDVATCLRAVLERD